MERVINDETMLRCRSSSPKPSFLSTFWRRKSRTNSASQVLFKERRRIVVFGAAKVGKSSKINQFRGEKFTEIYKETIEDLYVVDYNLSTNKSLSLEILDTNGAFQFPAMHRLAISNSDALLLVYSSDNIESWQEIEKLRRQIIDKRGPGVPIVIAGNIFDDNHIVKRDVVEQAVQNWRCGHVECDAKKNKKIVKVFEEILNQSNINFDLKEAVERRSNTHRRSNTPMNMCSK